MTGRYELEFRARNGISSYKLDLTEKVTVLRKKNNLDRIFLYEMVRDLSNADELPTLYCNMPDIVVPLCSGNWEYQVKEYSGKIIFADECHSSIVSSLKFAQSIVDSDNYFVLVSPINRFLWLTYAELRL